MPRVVEFMCTIDSVFFLHTFCNFSCRLHHSTHVALSKAPLLSSVHQRDENARKERRNESRFFASAVPHLGLREAVGVGKGTGRGL